MKCPYCGSEDWDYSEDRPIISELDDNGYAIQIDFPCYCPDCDGSFYRREEFVHAGKKTEWIVMESE